MERASGWDTARCVIQQVQGNVTSGPKEVDDMRKTEDDEDGEIGDVCLSFAASVDYDEKVQNERDDEEAECSEEGDYLD